MKPLRSLTFPGLDDSYTVPTPIAATEDMTQPVGVDADGLLFTAPGEGAGEFISLVDQAFQMTDAVTQLQFDLPSTQALKEVYIYAELPASTTTGITTNVATTFEVNNVNLTYFTPMTNFGIDGRNIYIHAILDDIGTVEIAHNLNNLAYNATNLQVQTNKQYVQSGTGKLVVGFSGNNYLADEKVIIRAIGRY